MIKYTWHEEEIPKNLEIKQVHGVLVTDDGRIMVRIKNGSYRLTGGHPEPEDTDPVATMQREAKEEADCELDFIDYIGYQEVTGDGEPYAQMRVVARIAKINPATPDPDRSGSWTYGRKLITPADAIENLPFGEINEKLIFKAMDIATENNYFTEPISEEEELINPEDKQSDDPR